MEKPLRVAHIIGKNGGGVDSVVMSYCRTMDPREVRFDLLVDEKSTHIPEQEMEEIGGQVHRIPPHTKPLKRHKTLVRLLRRNRYRVVHAHLNTLNPMSLLAAKRAGVPVRIAHAHSTAGKGEPLRNLIKNTLRPFSRACATHFIACSDHAGRWLFGRGFYDSGRVAYVKNAIDTGRFTYSQEVRNAVRQDLGLEGRFVVGHVGRFVTQKNHRFLLEIFAAVRAKRSDAVLLLVGDGELRREIEHIAVNRGLQDAVRFLGQRPDVHRLLQAMDVFLLPSLYEGLPVVVVEALASGLPVVMSDRVTEEAAILPDACTFFPLEVPARHWAEQVLLAPDNLSRDRSADVAAAGYEIRTAAPHLMDLYQEWTAEKLPDGEPAGQAL